MKLFQVHFNDIHSFGQTVTTGLFYKILIFTFDNLVFLAHFLARKFNLHGKITLLINDKNLLEVYINGVVSCAYIDVITNVLTCIFNGVNFEDRHDQNYSLTKKILSDLKALNNLLKKSSTSFYYDQTEPTIADYFVFEAYTLARDYYQKLIPNGEYCQALIKHEQIMKERPGLANYFNRGLLSKRITGSSKENEYMAKLTKTQE